MATGEKKPLSSCLSPVKLEILMTTYAENTEAAAKEQERVAENC